MQKYADDTRTTCRRHITRGFCPKMKKKTSLGAKMAKKIQGRYAKQDIFFSLSGITLKYLPNDNSIIEFSTCIGSWRRLAQGSRNRRAPRAFSKMLACSFHFLHATFFRILRENFFVCVRYNVFTYNLKNSHTKTLACIKYLKNCMHIHCHCTMYVYLHVDIGYY